MRRIALTALISLLPGISAAGSTEDYTAAIEAQKAGDCPAMLGHLDQFLSANPDLKDSHRDFYLQVKIVMGQCAGSLHVSGSGEDSLEMDPLPAPPPNEE